MVIMELASFRRRKQGIRVSVEWAPCEGNRDADSLANGDVSSFSPSHRLRVVPSQLRWLVLAEAHERQGCRTLQKRQDLWLSSCEERAWASALTGGQATCQGSMVSVRRKKTLPVYFLSLFFICQLWSATWVAWARL